jgi:hypothetical protein
MGMGMGMPPPPGAMMQMSTCGFMGQQMRVCQGNEMRQIQSGESGEGSDAGGTPELPQAVQRLFAAYENQPCAPVGASSLTPLPHPSRVSSPPPPSPSAIVVI